MGFNTFNQHAPPTLHLRLTWCSELTCSVVWNPSGGNTIDQCLVFEFLIKLSVQIKDILDNKIFDTFDYKIQHPLLGQKLWYSAKKYENNRNMVFLYFIYFFFGDVIIIGEGLKILTNALHSWPLTSQGSKLSPTYCDTGVVRLYWSFPRTLDTHTYVRSLAVELSLPVFTIQVHVMN